MTYPHRVHFRINPKTKKYVILSVLYIFDGEKGKEANYIFGKAYDYQTNDIIFDTSRGFDKYVRVKKAMLINVSPYVFYKTDNTLLLTNSGKIKQCIELMKSYNEYIKFKYKSSRDVNAFSIPKEYLTL